ncbi:hypothetical protein KOAAANKH_01972 [Brevundimonas sp. NIBR10]|uniref:hypothetical protein n=1 Tax=Brevundimonas sp. NIBR10 TaxID=3015997 RepID=UPI0022F14B11|nr:hypothetical protein [Brevundimonas sp. NIBR10]WGM47098.1 hypothetical protein KOAAANKH_01972 [Brevundimonas sp. NIBR10]
MFATIALFAALLLPISQSAPVKPATPAEIAAARVIADRLISEAGARGVFENATEDGTPTVLHPASGLTCGFSGDRHDYIRIFPASLGGVERGDDVACGMWMLGSEHTIYATRYPDRHSAREDLDAAIAAFRQRLPNARPHTGDVALVSREGGPDILLAAYDVEIEDQPKLSLILVSKVGDWSFKHRATGPIADETLALMAGMSFILSLPGGRSPTKP